MTTRELADLLEHLRQGLGSSLRSESVRAFEEAVEAFREIPELPLKKLAEQLRTTSPRPGGSEKGGKPTVNVDALVERIRAVRAGVRGDTLNELNGLNNSQLRAVLAAFGQPATTSTAGNLAKVRQLLEAPSKDGALPIPSPVDPVLTEEGVKLYTRLRDTRELSILEVRLGFAPLREYPKPVLEEISRRVGYTPNGSRKDILDRLQTNLEDIKMHQLRSGLVGSGA